MRSIRFGGLGDRREVDHDDLFEVAVAAAFGERLRADRVTFGRRLYSSLTNTEWSHRPSGEVVGYSFRAAGDLLAALLGEGGYMDWYCSAPEGVVDPEVAAALARKGWQHRSLP